MDSLKQTVDIENDWNARCEAPVGDPWQVIYPAGVIALNEAQHLPHKKTSILKGIYKSPCYNLLLKP